MKPTGGVRSFHVNNGAVLEDSEFLTGKQAAALKPSDAKVDAVLAKYSAGVFNNASISRDENSDETDSDDEFGLGTLSPLDPKGEGLSEELPNSEHGPASSTASPKHSVSFRGDKIVQSHSRFVPTKVIPSRLYSSSR
jgi:hypothetical protein